MIIIKSFNIISLQAMESLHKEAKSDLQDQRLVAKENPKCGENLVNCITRVNGRHI